MNIRFFTTVVLTALATLSACTSNTHFARTKFYYSKEKGTALIVVYDGYRLTKEQDFQVFNNIINVHSVALWQKSYKAVAGEIESDRRCVMFISYHAGAVREHVNTFNCTETSNDGSFQTAIDQIS